MSRPLLSRLVASLASVALLVTMLPIRADDAAERASTMECLTLSARFPADDASPIPAYERCRDLDPHDAVLEYDLATLYEASGDPRAEASYRRAVAIDPSYADAYVRLGWLRLRRGDAAGARSDAERALTWAPNSAAATALREAAR
jgi:tetratricopeptide (TPR) repeat protein